MKFLRAWSTWINLLSWGDLNSRDGSATMAAFQSISP